MMIERKRAKSVSFDSNVHIHYMHVWSFAYRSARKGEWMRNAADKFRFELRKQKLEASLTKIGFFSRQLK